MPTNAIILANAPISCVLAGNDIAKGNLFGQRIDPLLAQKIYATYFVIKKIYDLDPTYEGMDVRCQYLWEIMTKYGIRAQSYTGGGGTVAPPTSGARPEPLDFIVDATSPIPTGASGLTITTFIGWNVQFSRGGIEQNTTDVGDGSSYFTYSRTTGTITISPAAGAGELFRITPV